MPRIQPVDVDQPSAEAAPLLDGLQQKLGRVPNIYATMAQAPAVLKGALDATGTLGETSLSGALREQIALAVGGANRCDYCAAAHTAIGKMNGLTDDQTQAALAGSADDAQAQAAITFARAILDREGFVTDDQLAAVKAAGFGDQQIVEIIAVTVFNIFTNYINHIAETTVDFPEVQIPETV
ncbi:carboxymuconolactone decarboxylase family protein [Algisphaera agarilytica]|uniref:Putative peroxidase-related enzyme n=1 Tax=Algisphaera agarilytica TaxID=1385975 RepID=A0A7X0LKP8_9BACT|nr:carboxymuconolactone decarboxylase family protein [Algisphaera agarilytica]MBB6430064.1 putative peroxidase-related enzyme [Algisphaera agarilytica]